MELVISPVIIEDIERVPQPSGGRNAVAPVDGEDRPPVGLRCSFCDRYYPTFGSDSMMSVIQIQVSQNGEEAKRWGGGELVWQCKACSVLKRKVTQDGRKVINTRVPQATVAQVKQLIGNIIYSKVQGTKW
jgi:hypothetical protein